jgi:hypothetical protein
VTRTGRWSLPILTLALAVLTAVTWPGAAVAASDWDGDGAIATDCRPLDPAVHPAAVDHPDLTFEDLNCDGIDGDKDGAYFVQPSGDDNNVGTFNAPFKTIQKAIDVAKTSSTKSIYVATGTYNQRLVLPFNADGVRIYGGYAAGLWSRSNSPATTVSGQPDAALLDGATDVVFQLMTFSATRGGDQSAYGLRSINSSEMALIRVSASAGAGAEGTDGSGGSTPAKAASGDAGKTQVVPEGQGGTPCDYAGAGGSSAQPGNGHDGGAGGTGGEETNDGENGQAGSEGGGGSPGGDGGPGGTDNAGDADNPASTENGKTGGAGAIGAAGANGSGGGGDLAAAGTSWVGREGTDGAAGGPGYGGGGGGGGAGDGAALGWSSGAGGGQGGDGGAGGGRGTRGSWGGGSFGLYLRDSQAAVVDGSTVQAGAGGRGGHGGSGASGGAGGDGGPGGTAFACSGSKRGGHGGSGGSGGPGGSGGSGGGGSGGPSIGIARLGTSLATVSANSTAAAGTPGSGGTGPGAAGEGASGQSGAMLPGASSPTDFDGDGITDAGDGCVEIHRNSDLNGDGTGDADGNGDGCPDRAAALPDGDGDGVPNDGRDACPATPAGSTDANSDGCPDSTAPADGDGDGIPDSADACPTTPAGSNDANGDGCPDTTQPGTGSGGSGGTGSTPPPLDTLAPTLLVGAKAQRALRTKALVWTGRCGEACAYTGVAMLGRRKLGQVKKQLAAGVTAKLKLRLSRKAQGLLRNALARKRKVTVTLKSAAVDAAGNKRSASNKLVVKR